MQLKRGIIVFDPERSPIEPDNHANYIINIEKLT